MVLRALVLPIWSAPVGAELEFAKLSSNTDRVWPAKNSLPRAFCFNSTDSRGAENPMMISWTVAAASSLAEAKQQGS